MRYHATVTGNIPFTAEEEAARDAEEFAILNAPPQIPQEVPKWAAEIALIDAGLDALPQQYLDSLPAGVNKKKAIALHRSRPMWRRNSTMLQAAIAAGLVTSTQVDDLFIAADVIAKTA